MPKREGEKDSFARRLQEPTRFGNSVPKASGISEVVTGRRSILPAFVRDQLVHIVPTSPLESLMPALITLFESSPRSVACILLQTVAFRHPRVSNPS